MGQTVVEILVVVAVVSAVIGSTFVSTRRTRESAMGSFTAIATAFQVARREAAGNTKSVGTDGATLLFSRDANGDAIATIYDGLAGTTFTGQLVQRIDIPARLTSGSGQAASPTSLAILFSPAGNLTYANWTIGRPLSPSDCTGTLTLTLATAVGTPMGYAQVRCGSQTLTLENKSRQPLATAP